MFFGGAAGYLLMMFIIIYVNMVMRSVIEEKTNRIVEIIISSVKPIHLMLGKIIGTSLAGISQFAIWVILGSLMLTAITVITGVDFFSVQTPQQEALNQIADSELQQLAMDIARLPLLSLTIFFLIYFIGGYFLYSSIYAAIGAAVDNETDTQQFMLPITIPLILSFVVAQTVIIRNPDGPVAFWMSVIPLTSPISMMLRIPFGVPLWELLLSMLLLVAGFIFTTWIAARIYRVGILMYGKKVSYKELSRWLFYKL